MVLIPRSRALDEGHVLRCLAIGRPEDFPFRRAALSGQAFHHEIGDDVRALAECQIFEVRRVVGTPARGDDDGPDIDGEILLAHSHIDGPGRREFGQRQHVLIGECLPIQDMEGRPGGVVRIIQGFGGSDVHVEVVGPLRTELIRDGIIQGMVSRDVTRTFPDPRSEITRGAHDFLHGGQRVHGDPGISLDAADVDLEAAGGRTHFGEVLM